MNEVSKILTYKKKDQSAETKTSSEMCKFSPYASEISQISKDADRLNLSETALGHPSEKFIHMERGGGGGWLDIKRVCTQRTELILAAGIERD